MLSAKWRQFCLGLDEFIYGSKPHKDNQSRNLKYIYPISLLET